MNKKILMIFVILAALIIGFIFFNQKGKQNASTIQPNTTDSQSESPKIISTKPDPLEDAIVSASEVIEITFNKPIENIGEFKSKIEPEISYKVELSSDRKTARVIPAKPYDLGLTYTLFIGTETKFDGVGRWGEEKIFHFKTIAYRGV